MLKDQFFDGNKKIKARYEPLPMKNMQDLTPYLTRGSNVKVEMYISVMKRGQEIYITPVIDSMIIYTANNNFIQALAKLDDESDESYTLRETF